MKTKKYESDPWSACTWDGARDDVLLRGRRMTFREKIFWLEQSARLSRRFTLRPPGDDAGNPARE